jgi:alginate O-acetyltransferase complex protein AlgI
VDIYRGGRAEPNVWRYCLFVTFFPHLIAGPIVHHAEMLPQFNRGRLNVTIGSLSVGLSIFSLGLFKKVVFADPIGEYADTVFGTAELGTPISFVSAWTGVAAFALKIYFDFSGYSDMAIGLAKMFGVQLPLNFDSPYKATSIIDFWHRWHMTLSRFLREYIYIPLGGNRKGEVWRYANVLIVMLIGGLWHGPAWTFVAWGALHGLYLIINHMWRRLTRLVFPAWLTLGPIAPIASGALTLVAVMFAWALFRAESWDSARNMINGMLGLNGIFLPQSYSQILSWLAPALEAIGVTFGVEPDPAAYPTLRNLLHVIVLFALTLVAPNTQELMCAYQPTLESSHRREARRYYGFQWQPTASTGVITAVLLLTSFSTFLLGDRHAFIYFQF